MKKLSSFILMFIMVFTLIPLGTITSLAYTLSGTAGNCTWTRSDDVLTINGNGAMEDYERILSDDGAVEIFLSSAPWGGDHGYPRADAIIVTEGITHIGDYSFYNYNEVDVYLPKSISSIGDNAFNAYVDDLYGLYSHSIKNVYYDGSMQDRMKIDFGSGNDALANATWHYAIDKKIEGTLIKEADGHWYYYPNGQRSSKTTLTNFKGKWFYVKNGMWDKTYTGLFEYNGNLLYIENGKWNKQKNGELTEYQGTYFHIKDGKWDKFANGFVKYKGVWFYLQNGKWARKIRDRLVEYKGKHFYLKSGKWMNTLNGVIYDWNSQKHVLLKNGKWSKETKLAWYSWNWCYIENGIWQQNKTTKLFKYNGKYFYIENCIWKKETALKKIGKELYYIKNGKWNSKEHTVFAYNGEQYYINNGKNDPNFSGTAVIQGKPYIVSNGKVILE